jgi:cobalamin biosynthesis protein CobT
VDSSLEKDIVNMVTSPKDMGYKDIIEKVKDKERDDLSEKLTDVILEAKEGAAVPSSLAKKILYSRDEGRRGAIQSHSRRDGPGRGLM